MTYDYADFLGIIEVLISIPFLSGIDNPKSQVYKWNDSVATMHITNHSVQKTPIFYKQTVKSTVGGVRDLQSVRFLHLYY
jgi:uncharacterized membrane protein YkgB